MIEMQSLELQFLLLENKLSKTLSFSSSEIDIAEIMTIIDEKILSIYLIIPS